MRFLVWMLERKVREELMKEVMDIMIREKVKSSMSEGLMYV